MYLVWWDPYVVDNFNKIGFYGIFHTLKEATLYKEEKEEQEKLLYNKDNGNIEITKVDIFVMKSAVFEKVKNDN